MKLILISLCAGAVVFMLRFLAAVLREGKSLHRDRQQFISRKSIQLTRHRELIIMHSKNYAHKSQ
jgi:hypothetical protein